MKNFAELNLLPAVMKSIQELGYEKPSDIQSQALPILLGNPTDFIGLAATGTGKTAAFSIPMLHRIDPKKHYVQALVLCPTRELAQQVSEQINLLGKHLGVQALPIYGGAGYDEQLRGLKKGPAVVVGTPGRVIDHLERGTLKMDRLELVILDEADKMISMGFKEELDAILEAAPRETANIWLFSATMEREVRRVADTYLRDPAQVQINKTEMLSAGIEQIYYMTQESSKPEVLCKLIDKADGFYGLVFCQTKSLVMDLTSYMLERGYKADCLHGDLAQSARERTMNLFKNKKISVLVCTDVASRGLDVKDVTHVINYSIPRELDLYVHRIGRTARSGKTGIAMSLVTASHRVLVGRIEQMTKSKMKEGTIPTRKEVGTKKVSNILAKFQEQAGYQKAIEIMGEDWKAAIADMSKEEIVARFLSHSFPEVFAERDQKDALKPMARAGGDAPRKEYGRPSNGRAPERRGPNFGGGGGYVRRDGPSAPRGAGFVRSGDRRDDRRGPPRGPRGFANPGRPQSPNAQGYAMRKKTFVPSKPRD